MHVFTIKTIVINLFFNCYNAISKVNTFLLLFSLFFLLFITTADAQYSPWVNFTWGDGLPNDYVNAIYEDSQGVMWFGTEDGVCRYDVFEWTTFTTADGLANNYVLSIFEDSQGAMRFGTAIKGGVSRFKGDNSPPNTKIIAGLENGELSGVSTNLFTFKGVDSQIKEQELKFSYVVVDSSVIPSENDWSPFFLQTFINTPPLPNGTYTFYVRSRDEMGIVDPTPAQRTFTIDITPPTVAISAPSNGDIVYGELNIIGLAFDNSETPDFKSYTLEYGKGSDEEKICEWHTIANGITKTVKNWTLGVWDTEKLFGTYVLRLRAVDSFDHRSKDTITVHVVAAAEDVDRREGGYVKDISEKINLYIPPNGIQENKQITITPVDIDEITIPTGQELELAGNVYDIEPVNLELLKTATLSVLQENGEESPETNWQYFAGRILTITGRKLVVRLTAILEKSQQQSTDSVDLRS